MVISIMIIIITFITLLTFAVTGFVLLLLIVVDTIFVPINISAAMNTYFNFSK